MSHQPNGLRRGSNLGFLGAIAAASLVALIVAPALASRGGELIALACIGPFVGLLAYGLMRRRGTNPNEATERADASTDRMGRVALGLISFVLGPAIGSVLSTLVVFVGDVHPLDRAHTIINVTILGGIAGGVVGLVLLLSAGFRR